jgi:hypothetical protein
LNHAHSGSPAAAPPREKAQGHRTAQHLRELAEANGLEKVIDLADFNDEEKLGKGKEMQDRLSNLVAIFEDLDFRGSKAEGTTCSATPTNTSCATSLPRQVRARASSTRLLTSRE